MSGPGMAKLPNGQTTIKSFGALLAKAKDINDADVAAEAKESVKIKKDKAEAKPKKKDDKSTKAAKPTKVFKVKKEAKAKVKAKASKTAAKAKAKSAAKVKKEKGIKVKSAATAKAKAKAKAKAEPQAKAKSKQPKSNWIKRRREKVAEKSEKQKKEKKESKSEKAGSEKPCKLEGESGLDWGKKFYKNQVGFINQVVDGEWTISFGALGTGLVGVRMRSKAPVAPAMAPPVVPPAADAEAPVAEAPAAEAPVEGDAGAPAAGVAGAEGAVEVPVEAPVEAKARRVKLQKEDLLVLFRNAPACGAQTRGSKTLAGYSGGALDVDEFTLEWSSQRSDMENKVIDQVVDHIGSGGVTMVAVKPPSSAENIAYRLLGQVSKVDDIKLAQRLCEPGERVICEEGSGKVHLAMTPNCFGDNKALLDSKAWGSGPLLSVKRYSEDDGRLCKHCCFRTPSATLHFEHLEPAGVEAYTRARGQRKVKEEKEEKEDPEEQEEQAAPPRPKRRMRCKKPLEAEEAPVEADVDVDATPEGPAPDPREELKEWPEFVSIKLEPTDR